MAEGMAAGQANTALEAIRGDSPYIQLHTGAPGAAGTANKCTDVTRKAVTFAAASGGAMSTSADIDWTSITATGTEDATHFSLWRGTGAYTDGTGTFCWSGTLTANPFVTGDNIHIAAGDITLTIGVAS